MTSSSMLRYAAVLTLGIAPAGLLLSQSASPALTGAVEHIKVHGRSLEGNLEGDSPDRDVYIWLPPSYPTHKGRRYPVVYMLHGFTDSAAKWYGGQPHWIHFPGVMDKALADGAAREMIVVTPDAFTRYEGSMYSNSATTGDWEDFIARELVAWVDSHYRTIAATASRGLAGHSMGGYGALRIGMKRPDVFSSIYLLSPCCLAPGGPANPRAESIKTIEEFEKADFFTKASFASAAAWSPDPKNPPFFLDLLTRDGEVQAVVRAKWTANSPLAMIDQYITNLKRLHAIGFDAGAHDEPIASTVRSLDQTLVMYGIEHAFEIYDGNHINHVPERIETKAMPFFTKNLSFENAGH